MKDKDTILLESAYNDIIELQRINSITPEQVLQEGAELLAEVDWRTGVQGVMQTTQDVMKTGAQKTQDVVRTVGGKVQDVTQQVTDKALGGTTTYINDLWDKAMTTITHYGIGAVTGAILAQILSWVMNNAVKKIVAAVKKEKEIAGAAGRARYDIVEADWKERVINKEPATDKELEDAQRAMIDAIEDKTKNLNIGRAGIAGAVKRVADWVGGKWGTMAFTIGGMMVVRAIKVYIGIPEHAQLVSDKEKCNILVESRIGQV